MVMEIQSRMTTTIWGGLQKAKWVMELAKCIAEIGLLSFCVPSNPMTLSCTATMLLG
jgi:hypothetical protein